MPAVDITLLRSQSAVFVRGVATAVREALGQELGIGGFAQAVHRHDADLMIVEIDGVDAGEPAMRHFYETLVRLLEIRHGVRRADVLVMITEIAPAGLDQAFASARLGTDGATTVENLWLFDLDGGTFAHTHLFYDSREH